jgi:catechol 2,3-dioxygenase-like lactoylglutathione lyase family enzyme
MRLTYVMKFVSNMDTAVKFYRDTLGLPLKIQSPGWSEFATGDITLALHPASEKNPPGKVELGFSVEDLKAFHADLAAKGVQFPMAPRVEGFGALAQFLDSEEQRAVWPRSPGKEVTKLACVNRQGHVSGSDRN